FRADTGTMASAVAGCCTLRFISGRASCSALVLSTVLLSPMALRARASALAPGASARERELVLARGAWAPARASALDRGDFRLARALELVLDLTPFSCARHSLTTTWAITTLPPTFEPESHL